MREIYQRLQRKGEIDLSAGSPSIDDPEHALLWSAARSVDAAVIQNIVTTKNDRPHRILTICGARIDECIDLRSSTLTMTLVFRGCWIHSLLLQDSDVISIGMDNVTIGRVAGDDLRATGKLNLVHSRCRGGIELQGARIGGSVNLDGSRVENSDGPAVNLGGAQIGHSVYLHGGFRADGEVRLSGTSIVGTLNCDSATIENPGGRSLNAGGLNIQRDVYMHHTFRSRGEVNLQGARIQGSLNMHGATIENPGSISLNCGGASIEGGVFLHHGFSSTGRINFRGVRVGQQLHLAESHHDNGHEIALDFSGVTVRGGMEIEDESVVVGGADLSGIRIHGTLRMKDVEFQAEDRTALDLSGAEITGDATLQPKNFQGGLALSNASVLRWIDSKDSWPDDLTLSGFTYQALQSTSPLSVGERLRWVALNRSGYEPQPYDCLANAYAQAGDSSSARSVLIAKQWARRKNHRRRIIQVPALIWSSLLRVVIGYGYQPWLAVWPLVILIVAGSAVFSKDYAAGNIVLTGQHIGHGFNPTLYTLALVLPVSNIQRDSTMILNGPAGWHSLTVAVGGWLLTLAILAALTGVFKRD